MSRTRKKLSTMLLFSFFLMVISNLHFIRGIMGTAEIFKFPFLVFMICICVILSELFWKAWSLSYEKEVKEK